MTTREITADAGVPHTHHLDARLMRHAYDGIHEYDNPLPGWWKLIFYATIVFAAGYGAFYHIAGWGKTPGERYEAALAAYQGQKTARDQAEAANMSDELLARRAADPKTLGDGRAIFAARCVACHAAEGQGLIGPNLTDHFQLHGDKRMDIYNTVKRGVPGTAMLAWGEQMSADEVIAVATYVTSLRGKDLPGKAREGMPVKDFAP